MHSRHITVTTLALALAVSAPALANKKADKADAKAEKSPEADKAAPVDSAAAADDLWFEAPISAAPTKPKEGLNARAKSAKVKVKVETPRYGLGLGLHNARNVRQAPRVEEQAEDMSLKLHQSDVRRVIRDHHRAISFCGQRAAKKGERQPQVMLHFRVDSKGLADNVSVTEVGGKRLPVMSTCMRRAAKSWRFPADTAGGDIEYPLMLNRR